MKKHLMNYSLAVLLGSCTTLQAANPTAPSPIEPKPACNTPACDHKHEAEHQHEGCKDHQHAEANKPQLPHDSGKLFALLEQQKNLLKSLDAASVKDEQLHEQLESLQAVVDELIHVLGHDSTANARVLGQLRNTQKACAKVLASCEDRVKLAGSLKQLQAQLGLVKQPA